VCGTTRKAQHTAVFDYRYSSSTLVAGFEQQDAATLELQLYGHAGNDSNTYLGELHNHLTTQGNLALLFWTTEITTWMYRSTFSLGCVFEL